MLIDWFTIIAQIVNFLVLVWLLKRFLYKPVLAAIAAREKSIVEQLADAQAKEEKALAERELYMRKNEEIDQQRATILSKASEDAAGERGRLLGEARKDADALRAKLQDAVNSGYRNLHHELARRTQAEVFAIARKTLGDLAGQSLELRMTEVFVQRMRALNSDEKGRLAAMFKSPNQPALIRSAYELESAQRAAIESAIKETLSTTATVYFEVVSNLVSGIELVIQGQKVAWSVADYLASLEKEVNELLKQHHGSE